MQIINKINAHTPSTHTHTGIFAYSDLNGGYKITGLAINDGIGKMEVSAIANRTKNKTQKNKNKLKME